jgi:hypothetical protein
MRNEHRRERGMILFVAVLLLALMGAMAISGLDSAARDQQAAGYYNRSNTALFAAEAGVQAAVALVDQNATTPCPGTLAFATQGSPVLLGDTPTWLQYGGQPRYYGDPTAGANAIACVATRQRAGGSMSVLATETVADWRIYVVGESPDGSRARLEVMHEVVMPGGGGSY